MTFAPSRKACRGASPSILGADFFLKPQAPTFVVRQERELSRLRLSQRSASSTAAFSSPVPIPRALPLVVHRPYRSSRRGRGAAISPAPRAPGCRRSARARDQRVVIADLAFRAACASSGQTDTATGACPGRARLFLDTLQLSESPPATAHRITKLSIVSSAQRGPGWRLPFQGCQVRQSQLLMTADSAQRTRSGSPPRVEYVLLLAARFRGAHPSAARRWAASRRHTATRDSHSAATPGRAWSSMITRASSRD